MKLRDKVIQHIERNFIIPVSMDVGVAADAIIKLIADNRLETVTKDNPLVPTHLAK